MSFFLLWPLFARAPRHWFLEFFLLSAPGVQSVVFCCAPLGAATFRRGQSKKQTSPRVSFFLLRPRKAGEGEAPLGAGTGPEQEKNVILLWPRAGAQRGFSFPCLSGPEQKKKKHPGWCFFFALAPCRRPTGLLLPLPFAGATAKKNTLGGVCFLLRPRADAHSLTAGLGGDASPSPGWCFFFLLRPRPDRGVFFFAVAPPGRSLTQLTVGWGDFGKARVVFFFLLRPRRVFLDNNKNVWGTTSGLKRPGGATAKKKTPLPFA